MDLNDLKEYIIGARKVAEYIDEDNVSFSHDKSPMIFDCKSEGFKIKYLLINDIFSWLCYLGLGDGCIADEEVDFINDSLDLNFTKDQIRKNAISKLNKDFKRFMPISFILFCEAEIVHKDLMISHSAPIYSDNLFALFGVLGESFISCDGEITRDEKYIYYEYLELLWQNLIRFKKRRGIDDTYDNLVGENLLKQDIVVKSNSNSKITNKMNLILKLISQGYCLHDLNSILYISDNIIAKWFCLGRLGDKNFEEFYFKCIKLNPSIEMEIDEVMESINIFNIDDDIYHENNEQIAKHNTKKDKKDFHSQKNQFYKLKINKLNSQFQSNEKNTKDLIEKCFPAPQMTNSKFNHEVDQCSILFHQKFENTMMMIDSITRYSDKLENEIILNIESLNGINNKLNSLHDELLINISKSGDKDIENLLGDMVRLIDSVKYY